MQAIDDLECFIAEYKRALVELSSQFLELDNNAFQSGSALESSGLYGSFIESSSLLLDIIDLQVDLNYLPDHRRPVLIFWCYNVLGRGIRYGLAVG